MVERIGAYDLGMLYWFTSWRGPYLDRLLPALTHLGDPLVLINAVVAGALLLGAMGRRRMAWTLVVVAVLSGALDGALKYAVGRPRPNLATALVEPPATPSFPSGHAASSMTVYGSLGLLVGRALGRQRGRLLRYGVGLSVVVGLTRVMIGVHYPLDVLVGWGLGVLLVVGAGQLAGPARLTEQEPPEGG